MAYRQICRDWVEFGKLDRSVAASTLGIIVFSRGASFDIVVTFPITASLAGFIIYDVLQKRRFALFCFYFFIGVALTCERVDRADISVRNCRTLFHFH